MPELLTTPWWDSRTVRRLNYLAAFAASILIIRVGWQEDLSWLAAVVVFVAVALLTAVRWPYGALFVLIAMSATPVFYLEISGWKARPEHFAATIVLAAVVVAFLVFKRRVQFDKLDLCISAYVVMNFISSAFASPAPSSTLRWALQNSLAVAAYFLIRTLVSDLTTLRICFRILLGVGLAESVYGIGCWISHQLFNTSAGVQVGQYLVDVAAPFGSMYEPNLFGAYTGGCAVLFLAFYLFEGRRMGYLICFLITSLATVISFSRAALLALILSSLWLFWKARGTSKIDPKKFAITVLALGLIVALASTTVGSVLRERFTSLYYDGLTDETTISRVVVIQEALQDIPGHLLLGNGTASFNLTFDWARYMPEWSGEQTWIGNAPLRILHDTGVLGLAAVVAFFVFVWRKVHRIKGGRFGSSGLLAGLQAGTLLYAISFESTDGTILAFFWVHLGLLASAAILLGAATEDRSAVIPAQEIG
jgi:hypothetical protein